MEVDGEIKFHERSFFRVYHYIVSQTLALLLFVVTTIILIIIVNERFSWILYLIPSLPLYLWMIYSIAWDQDWTTGQKQTFLSCIGFLILLPLFWAIYILVWEPIFSLEWIEMQNCKIQGQFSGNLGDFERYSLQYVSLDDQLYGISCISNRESHGTQMRGYDFYNYGDFYSCNPNLHENEEEIKNGRCRAKYRFSGKKIPTWLCSTAEQNKNLLFNPQQSRKCYYSLVGSHDKAINNSRNITSPFDIPFKSKEDIFIVRMIDTDFYYFSEGFVCLILILLYPGILFALQVPSSYTAMVIIKLLCLIEIQQENKLLEEEEVNKQQQQQKPILKDIQLKNKSLILSTSEIDKSKQFLQPSQIVQALSPNSLLNDRDYYDIFQGTRIRQATTKATNTIAVTTIVEDNTQRFMIGDHTNDCTKMDLATKTNRNYVFEDLEEQIQESNNVPEKISLTKESENEKNSSYLKIRKVYKKKLDPKYQKEQKKQKEERICVENEEKQIIEEIKQKYGINFSEKQINSNKIHEDQQKQQEKEKQEEDVENISPLRSNDLDIEGASYDNINSNFLQSAVGDTTITKTTTTNAEINSMTQKHNHNQKDQQIKQPKKGGYQQFEDEVLEKKQIETDD